MKYSKWIFALFIFSSCDPAWSQVVLRGSIEHSEKIPTLSESLHPGMPFGQRRSLSEPDNWFIIPKWLSGSWRTIECVRTESSNDGKTPIEREIQVLCRREYETFGFQRDRHEGIWTTSAVPAPLNRKDDNDKTIREKVLVFRENYLVSREKDKLVFRTMDTAVSFDERGFIKAVNRSEVFRTFEPISDNKLSIHCDQQTYDGRGFKTTSSKTSEIWKREEPFLPQDEILGKSLNMSFLKYLERTGQSKLEPVR